MASAWGSSWGSSWGNSWGSIGDGPDPEPEPTPPAYAGGGMSGKRRRLLNQIKEEDEIVVAFITMFFEVMI